MNGTNSPNLDHVRQVLATHRDSLIALPGVVSVGVGRPDRTGPYIISVLMEGARPVNGPDRLDDVEVVYTPSERPKLQTMTRLPTEPARADSGETDTASTEAPPNTGHSTDQEP